MGLDPYSALAKYVAIGVGILSILGFTFYQGMEWTQTRWDAAVAEQQMATGKYIVQQAYNSVKSEKVHQQNLQRQKAELGSLAKKVRDYENGASPQCELSPEFESVADSISRVRQPATDGVPSSSDPTGKPAPAGDARLTDAAILSAYQGAVAQLYSCADHANALIDWVRSSNAIATEGAGR